MLKNICLRSLSFIYLLACTGTIFGQAQSSYDPREVNKSQKVETIEFDIEYQTQGQARLRRAESTSQNRKVPIKVYLPSGDSPTPVVLFSHGLGGSREGFKHGGEHWARRGYVAVFLQHPGSDESVWRGASLGQRRSALTEAANGQNLIAHRGCQSGH